jgi:hypothetical protein
MEEHHISRNPRREGEEGKEEAALLEVEMAVSPSAASCCGHPAPPLAIGDTAATITVTSRAPPIMVASGLF